MRRPASLAGRWYPSDARACRDAIASYAEGELPARGPWRALIGPHAGWAFSGACAARTYRALGEARSDAELVVVFGSHRGPHGPSTIFRADEWDTPLGPLSTERELAERIASELPLSDEPVRPARADNAVELHLPFVRFFFPRARFLMIGVAASQVGLEIGERVGELAREVGRDTVFVGSTDLTHYGPNYGFTPAGLGSSAVAWARERNDAAFLDAVLAGDSTRALDHAIASGSACCPGAAVAAIEAARAYQRTLAPALVDHYLSYDVRPDASFVGYAGVVL